MWRRDFPLAPSVLTSRAEPRRVLAVYPGVCSCLLFFNAGGGAELREGKNKNE